MSNKPKQATVAKYRPEILLATSLWNLGAAYTFFNGSEFYTGNPGYLSSGTLRFLGTINAGFVVAGLLGFRGSVPRRTAALTLGLGNLGQAAFEIVAGRTKTWDRGELTRYTIGDAFFGVLNLIAWWDTTEMGDILIVTEDDKGHINVETIEIEV